jgi:spore maturation protein CgeB
MRDRSFISNRLFDAAAAGAFVISDAMEGSAAVFGEDLVTYQSDSEFREKVEYYLAHSEERRASLARIRLPTAPRRFWRRSKSSIGGNVVSKS